MLKFKEAINAELSKGAVTFKFDFPIQIDHIPSSYKKSLKIFSYSSMEELSFQTSLAIYPFNLFFRFINQNNQQLSNKLSNVKEDMTGIKDLTTKYTDPDDALLKEVTQELMQEVIERRQRAKHGAKDHTMCIIV